MSTVAPSADDKSVQVFVVPAHGELHHMMQLRDGDLLGNQKSPPDRRLTPHRLIRNWRTGDASEDSESIEAL